MTESAEPFGASGGACAGDRTGDRTGGGSVDGAPWAEPVGEHDFGFRRAAAKVREFPQTPGVYLMKDSAGRVIYVGKAKNLRSRAGSYFSKTAAEELRTATGLPRSATSTSSNARAKSTRC